MLNITIQIQAETLQEALVALSSGAAEALMQTAAGPQPDVTTPIIPIATAVPESPAPTTASEAPVTPTTPVTTQASDEPPPPVATVPPAAVPTAAPKTYTEDELMRAAAVLMDAGKMGDIQQVLSDMGVSTFTQLPPDRYGEFAMALKGLGAKL